MPGEQQDEDLLELRRLGRTLRRRSRARIAIVIAVVAALALADATVLGGLLRVGTGGPGDRAAAVADGLPWPMTWPITLQRDRLDTRVAGGAGQAGSLGARGSSQPLPLWDGPAPAVAAAPTQQPTDAGGVDPVPAVEASPTTTAPAAEPAGATPTPTASPTGAAVPTPAPATPVPTATTAPPTGPSAPSPREARVLELVNAARAAVPNCPALTYDARLAAAAQGHASDMVARQYFSHTGQDGSTPSQRAQAAGYPGEVAENFATGYADADAAVRGWLDSAVHRENILNCSYRVTGVGYDAGSLPGYGAGMWVQLFGASA